MFGNYDSTKTSERIERKIKDKTFLLDVVNKTSLYTGKQLLTSEIEGLIQYVQSIDSRLIVNKPRDVIVDALAKNFASRLRSTKSTMVDTHELMKQEIGTIKTDGESVYRKLDNAPYNPHKDKIESYGNYGDKSLNSNEEDNYLQPRPTLPLEAPGQLENSATPYSSLTDKFPRIAKQSVQNVYLLLDSKYRNLSSDPSVFQWTVLNSANTVQGTVNTLSDQIHNITNIQFDRFNLPYVGSADNVYQKISLFVEEFSSMSVLIHSGRYHMIFDSEITGNRIRLTPLVNDEGRFRFHTPINILDTITLSFRSPFSKITFQPDRYNVIVSSLNTTQSLLTFDENHGVSFINNTQLRIDVNLSTIVLLPTLRVDCFIATRRLIIPVIMEYLV